MKNISTDKEYTTTYNQYVSMYLYQCLEHKLAYSACHFWSRHATITQASELNYACLNGTQHSDVERNISLTPSVNSTIV